MLYKSSYEEHMLLASMRREKDSFERLIKERGVNLFSDLFRIIYSLSIIQTMLLPMIDDKTTVFKDSITRPTNSRIAGGRIGLNQPQKVPPFPYFSQLFSLPHVIRSL
jgi:DNA excision repair protein ERCC-4